MGLSKPPPPTQQQLQDPSDKTRRKLHLSIPLTQSLDFGEVHNNSTGVDAESSNWSVAASLAASDALKCCAVPRPLRDLVSSLKWFRSWDQLLKQISMTFICHNKNRSKVASFLAFKTKYIPWAAFYIPAQIFPAFMCCICSWVPKQIAITSSNANATAQISVVTF